MTKVLINIDVPDLVRARRFYMEAVDLKQGRRFDGWVELVAADSTLIYLLPNAEGSEATDAEPSIRRTFKRHCTPLHLDFVVEALEPSVERALKVIEGRPNIVDLGCGRGEFLELLAENGMTATGVDGDPESVGMCLAKSLNAVEADLFAWLEAQPDHSLDGVFCGQVIEHLPPPLVPSLFNLCAAKSRPGAIAVFETPNPECLGIFASHFYLDPTHQRPVPSALAAFYLQEAGYGRLEIRSLAPAIESMPSLASLPPDFRAAFFGGLDYAIIGTRL